MNAFIDVIDVIAFIDLIDSIALIDVIGLIDLIAVHLGRGLRSPWFCPGYPRDLVIWRFLGVANTPGGLAILCFMHGEEGGASF